MHDLFYAIIRIEIKLLFYENFIDGTHWELFADQLEICIANITRY